MAHPNLKKRFTNVAVFLAVFLPLFAAAFWLSEPGPAPDPITATSRLQCVSYAPFLPGESPHSFLEGLIIPRERVAQDFDLLARHFDCVRVYSMTGLEFVPELARARGMKLLMGMWINADQKGSMKELALTTRLARDNADVVKGVVVGNETLLRGEINAETLGKYLKKTKEAVGDLPVTYADVWEFWISNKELAPFVDFITIHILPYWEDEPIAVESAVAHVRDIHARVAQKFPGKPLLIGETGWPARGKPRWGAVPSFENQAIFIRGIIDEAKRSGWEYSLIEAFDQDWKAWQEGTVGGSWGLYTSRRTDKNILGGEISYAEPLRRWALTALAIVGVFYTGFLLIGGSQPRARHIRLLLLAIPTSFILSHAANIAFGSISLWGDKTYLAWWVVLQLISFTVLAERFVLGRVPVTSSPESSWLTSDRHSFFQLLATVLLCGTAAFLFYEALSQLWLGRYRDYFAWGFLIPIVAIFMSRKEGDFVWEKLIMTSALACSLILAGNERFGNAAVILWMLTVAVLAIQVFFLPGAWSRLRVFRKFIGAVALGLAVAASIRYGFLESRPLSVQCLADSKPWWCAFQSVMGFLIHTGMFLLVGWGLVLFSLLKRRDFYAGAAVCFAFAVVLYGVRGAALGLLVASFLQFKTQEVPKKAEKTLF